jgi:gas vesicle protein
LYDHIWVISKQFISLSGGFMADNGFDRDSFLKGLLIGGVVGAVTALLFAPKAGKDLRADIKRKGEEAVEGTKRVYGEARERATQIISEAVEKAEELREEATRQLTKAKARAEQLLTNAEEKASEIAGSAKEILDSTKDDLSKKKDKVTTAVNAGLDAAKKELSR